MDNDFRKRRKSRGIYVGSVKIGGDEPIVVQSMTNTDTRDVAATINQINLLQETGCEVVRIAVPDEEAVLAIPAIKKKIKIPLIADIHFHYQLAINAIKDGVDGIRINPGNIPKNNIAEIVRTAKERQTVIRIGVNAGSLQKDLVLECGGVNAEALCVSALRNIEMFEDLGFDLIKLSLKSSDVPMMIDAYRMIADKTDYPLHLGVTEAGTLIDAAINEVSNARGTLGSFQKNTLESNLRNLRIASQNLTASESQIRDTDMAEEMSEFTKNQILVQAGTAMLAQANQMPQTVLQLFQ